ncbi:MAG: DUF1653 domain-containing protein [Patescibacteria group bacterium]
MGHKSQEDIQKEVDKARKKIVVGGLYHHYKNPEHLYVVEFVGCLESTEEICVGYRALYGKGILWVRKMENFLEEVKVAGKKVRRFKMVR